MKTIISKFGGSSLADSEQFKRVASVIKADAARRFVVASAPGKRDDTDIKVTDLLYRCCDKALEGKKFETTLLQIRDRFSEIITELNIEFDLESEIEIIRKHLAAGPQRDYMASRGEYLNSKILATYLGFDFVDAAGKICFNEDGIFDSEKTNELLGCALAYSQYAVIPGFYGTLPDGSVQTFSRGGSDVTGSIVARAVNADLYENWTDVSGMLSADPRIVENPRPIETITYKELRELSYMGASVLHEDAVFPVRSAGIPINIRNTNRPQDNGTLIVPALPKGLKKRKVTGIAGKKGFSSIHVEKSMMNSEVGFGAKLLQIIASHGVAFEHCPTGIDTMSVIVSTEQFRTVREEVMEDIKNQLKPEVLNAEDGLAMIAVVGVRMASSKGVAARVFQAVANAGINIRMIDQGSCELNIILGINESDYENAIRSIYRETEQLF